MAIESMTALSARTIRPALSAVYVAMRATWLETVQTAHEARIGAVMAMTSVPGIQMLVLESVVLTKIISL